MEKFVFVVCGTAEHIDTLHFSLNALKKFSKNEILILTDKSRNNKEILHHNIIDVKTPVELNNHQASIFLKTAVHRFIPRGVSYCYLDSDVVAVSTDCDDVFRERHGVINFAPDHCKINSFSAHAVNCGCNEKWNNWHNELETLLSQYDTSRQITDASALQKRKELFAKFELLRRSPLNYLLISLRFVLSPIRFKLDNDTFYNRWKRYWHDANGNVILYSDENIFKKIERHSNFVWSKIKQRWTVDGKYDVYEMKCDHLRQQIKKTFNIDVEDKEWQHWNGGVFLFDEQSHSFLDAWHEKTMHIFSLPEWKIRDQGTLIATVWQFGLQDERLLLKKFNFIADYYNANIMLDKESGIVTDDSFKTSFKPTLMHVYHNFGLKGWDIWDWLESVVSKEEE